VTAPTAAAPAAPDAPAVAEPTLRCPQCGQELDPSQEWCLRCGRAATTTVVRPRHWRVPLLLVSLLAALAGVGVAVLFVALSGDDENIVTTGELTRTITITTQSPTATVPTVPPTATAPTVPTNPGGSTSTAPAIPTVPGATTSTSPRSGTTTGGGGSSQPSSPGD
jgi:hypothetical protein